MTRYTEDEKDAILDQLAASGQSRAAFCRERSLCYKRVSAWIKKRGISNLPAGFVEVDTCERSNRVGVEVEVWLPGSVRVRFGANAATAQLVDFCRKVSGC